MTAEHFPERTIRYKTYAKSTLISGLNSVFTRHPDDLLQRTRASIEFPRTEVDYPCVVVRFFEREVFNAGVGHEEKVSFTGESDSIEVSVTLNAVGAVQLSWPTVANATGYKVYKGTAPSKETNSFVMTGASFTDVGSTGTPDGVPTEITALVDTPQPTAVVSPAGNLAPGTYYYRVTALTPSQVVKFQHYFYSADVEFAIYALTAYDRDLVADTVVQTVAMGTLDAYTNSFFERIYPSNDLYPDAQLHFININSDRIQGFGESQNQTPWGAEDALVYQSSYRVGVFGELYSLPPTLTYAMVQRVALAIFSTGSDAPVALIPPGTDPTAPGINWVSNSP